MASCYLGKPGEQPRVHRSGGDFNVLGNLLPGEVAVESPALRYDLRAERLVITEDGSAVELRPLP